VESGVIAAVVLIALVGGAAAVLARQRSSSWGLPALRPSAAHGGESDELLAGESTAALADGRPGVAVLHATPRPLRRVVNGSPDRTAAQPEPVLLDAAPAWSAQLGERLERIESALDAMRRDLERLQEHDTAAWNDLRGRRELDERKAAAALQGLKGEMLAAVASLRIEGQRARGERRAEVSADLYARLARLESALSAVTNPILLPGEPYSPPPELPTEALIWENWNEVGERAFALADAYSAQRLHLSAEASAKLGEFVTALRVMLTRSVYPNLQGHPDAAQQAALQEALVTMAADIPRARHALLRAYGPADET
jgi:hypothetical protein